MASSERLREEGQVHAEVIHGRDFVAPQMCENLAGGMLKYMRGLSEIKVRGNRFTDMGLREHSIVALKTRSCALCCNREGTPVNPGRYAHPKGAGVGFVVLVIIELEGRSEPIRGAA